MYGLSNLQTSACPRPTLLLSDPDLPLHREDSLLGVEAILFAPVRSVQRALSSAQCLTGD